MISLDRPQSQSQSQSQPQPQPQSQTQQQQQPAAAQADQLSFSVVMRLNTGFSAVCSLQSATK